MRDEIRRSKRDEKIQLNQKDIIKNGFSTSYFVSQNFTIPKNELLKQHFLKINIKKNNLCR